MRIHILAVLLVVSASQASAMRALLRASCHVSRPVTQLFATYKPTITPKANIMIDDRLRAAPFEREKEAMRSRIACLEKHIENLQIEIEQDAEHVRNFHARGLDSTNLMQKLESKILSNIKHVTASKQEINNLERDLRK